MSLKLQISSSQYAAHMLCKLYYTRGKLHLIYYLPRYEIFAICFTSKRYDQPFMGQSVSTTQYEHIYTYTCKSRLNQQQGGIMALCFMLLIK